MWSSASHRADFLPSPEAFRLKPVQKTRVAALARLRPFGHRVIWEMRHRPVFRDPQAAAPDSDRLTGMSATTCTTADVVHYQPPCACYEPRP
jgi:hypothetical protein